MRLTEIETWKRVRLSETEMWIQKPKSGFLRIFFLGFPHFPDFLKPKKAFLRILILGLPKMKKWSFNFFCLRLPEIETLIQDFEAWIFQKFF